MHVRRTTEMAGWAVLRVILVDCELAGRALGWVDCG